MPVEVRAHQGENIDSLLRRFKKSVERSGVLQELRKRERYQKPSELKHELNMEKKRKIIKMNKKMKELAEKDDNFGNDDEKEGTQKQFIRQQFHKR